MTLWGLIILAGMASGGDIPPAVQAWSDGLAEAYAHYKGVEPAWEPQSDAFPPCPQVGEEIPTAPRSSMSPLHRTRWQTDPAGAHRACAALRPTGWRLQMRLSPIDQRIFSPLVVRVAPVNGPGEADKVVIDLVERGVLAAKGMQALIPVGSWVVELNAPCGAGGLFPYELADAVQAVEAAAPGGASVSGLVAVSACGRRAFELQTRAEVLEDGRRPREYWGFDFPERRDRARGGARAIPDASALD